VRAKAGRPSCRLTLNSRIAAFPLPLAELKLLDFPGGGFWKFGDELDVLGNLESGDLGSSQNLFQNVR
jgi:hypothetical protein